MASAPTALPPAPLRDHWYEIPVVLPPGHFEKWAADTKIDRATIGEVPNPHVTLMYGLRKGSGEWARVHAIVEAKNLRYSDYKLAGDPWFVARANCWVQDLESPKLEQLHEELAKEFPHAAIKLKGRTDDDAVEKFRPHVTLFYIKK